MKVVCDSKRHAKLALEEIRKQRKVISDWMKGHPEFGDKLEPLPEDQEAPSIVSEMIMGSRAAGVGPMAAVAGVIAEFACRRMKDGGSSVCLVENGGDIFAITKKPLFASIFAGEGNPLNGTCIELNRDNTPASVCSSSSSMGHSLSLGSCDLVTVISDKASIADSFATAVCNRIKGASDMEGAVSWACENPSVRTVIAVKGEIVSISGDAACLRPHEDAGAEHKITFHD